MTGSRSMRLVKPMRAKQMNYAIPTNDDITIPRPPNSMLLAFDKNGDGRCLGVVVAAWDANNEEIPDWMTLSTATYLLWTGVYIDVVKPQHAVLRWVMV